MIVDMHTHVGLPRYVALLRERTEIPYIQPSPGGDRLVIFPDEERSAGSTRPIREEYTALERKLAFMDQHGIDISVISLGNPWVDFLSPAEAPTWAARLNADLAAVCAQHPGRLYGLGVLPLQNVAAACRELDHLRELQLRGAIIGTRPGGLHLDDPALEPFWARAADMGVPISIHPHYALGLDWLGGHGHAMLVGLGFPFETAAAATRLILGGVLERFPRLRLILAHGGGALPYLAARVATYAEVDARATRHLKRPFAEYLAAFYLDALVYDAPALTLAQSVVPPDHLLFGTDHPFGVIAPAACYDQIRSATGTPGVAAGILGENARVLFGL